MNKKTRRTNTNGNTVPSGADYEDIYSWLSVQCDTDTDAMLRAKKRFMRQAEPVKRLIAMYIYNPNMQSLCAATGWGRGKMQSVINLGRKIFSDIKRY